MAKKAAKKAKARIPAPGDRRMKKPDRTSATRQTTPVRPERTASRAAAVEMADPKTITLDKLGRVQTWQIPQAPYKDEPSKRAAYVGGFLARTQQWQGHSHGVEVGVPDRFGADTALQQVFADGYHDAIRQDGGHLKGRTLTGSNKLTGKAIEAGIKARQRR